MVSILACFARACPELAEGVGGDAAGATLVRSTPPVVDAFVASSLRLKVGGDAEFLPNSCFL